MQDELATAERSNHIAWRTNVPKVNVRASYCCSAYEDFQAGAITATSGRYRCPYLWEEVFDVAKLQSYIDNLTSHL